MNKIHNLPIIDIHAHPTFRPFAFQQVGITDKASLRYKSGRFSNFGIANYNQTDLFDLQYGNVKIIFANLYSFEQEWVMPEHLSQPVTNIIASTYLDLPESRINQVRSKDYNYFDQLQKEYQFLEEQVKIQQPPYAILPKTQTELKENLDKNKIIFIPAVEGGHSFISGNAATIRQGIDADSIIKNIKLFKEQAPLFYVTLAHHFNNGFIQHAYSIYGQGEGLFDQSQMPDKAITQAGWRIIKCLLSISDECQDTRKVYLDIKHTGILARKKIYKFIDEINSYSETKIPIIYSHAAFSGVDKLDQLFEISITGGYYHGFKAYEINLATEDLWAIYKSKGLIGLILDEKKLGRMGLWNFIFGGKYKWIRMLLRNLLEMVERLIKQYDADKDVWDIFALGSDFDGLINPLNRYPTARYYQKLVEEFNEALSVSRRFKKYNFGYKPIDITRKIFWQNALDFTLKHFIDFQETSKNTHTA